MNSEEKILSAIEALSGKIDNLEGRFDKLEVDVVEIKNKLDDVDRRQQHTHDNLVCFENTMIPLVNALKEEHTITNKELSLKVDKLRETVEKLKFGEEVIRLVTLIEEKSKI